MAHPTTHGQGGAHGEHSHPGVKQYVTIAAILTIITALEVAVFYIPALASALLYILLVLSAGKFALVVMYYMHLKHDSKIFSGVFFAPMSLAVGVVIAMVILFKVIPLI